MKKSKKVAITGIGPIASVGIGKEQVWTNLMKSMTGLSDENFIAEEEVATKYYLHKIKDFDIEKFGIDKSLLYETKEWKEGDEVFDLWYFLAVIRLALLDSRLEYDPRSNNIGLVLTAESPGHGELYAKFLEQMYDSHVNTDCSSKEKTLTKMQYLQRFYRQFRKTGYDLQSFMTLFHTAKIFGLHGFSLIINNACASGLYALETAADLIRNNKCDTVVVAAVDHPNIFKSLWFMDVKMSPSDGLTRPFDKNSKGFVLGEGGVAFILEDLGSARKRKAHVYAEYLGGAFNQEAWKVTLPNVTESFYEQAIRKALEISNVKESDIDLVVPHGVATRISDKYEVKTLNNIFEKRNPGISVSALKSYIGHTLGASSLLETSIMLFMLENNLILPILNCENAYNEVHLTFIINKIRRTNLTIALKTCTAFAGFNAACVFRKLK